MPKLIFPVVREGLRVDVLIGLDGATTLSQLAGGLPITPPLIGTGEIDTGCDRQRSVP
jgi:hypothetical protein